MPFQTSSSHERVGPEGEFQNHEKVVCTGMDPALTKPQPSPGAGAWTFHAGPGINPRGMGSGEAPGFLWELLSHQGDGVQEEDIRTAAVCQRA